MKMNTTAKKWVAAGASMSLAAGLGVLGLSYANYSANAEGDVQTVLVNAVYTPAEAKAAEQRYHYDADGNLTRMDYDMLNMHLRDPQWNFLNARDAQEGQTATAHGRKFMYTTKGTLYKHDEIVRCGKHHTPGFWAPLNAKGEIDHRWGAWGVAGKATCEIGVGRLIYWDGSKWFNQSHFRVDYMDVSNGIHGYKVDAFREPSLSFDGTVDGDYTGDWPSLADNKDHQKLVSAAAYAFANDSKPEYATFGKFVGKNSERRGDLILQLAFGTDIASAAEKVLVYKARYAEMVEKVKAMVGNGFVTPGEALKADFHLTKLASSNKDKTVYQVKLDKIGNEFYPITEGAAKIKFVKDETAAAAKDDDTAKTADAGTDPKTDETAPAADGKTTDADTATEGDKPAEEATPATDGKKADDAAVEDKAPVEEKAPAEDKAAPNTETSAAEAPQALEVSMADLNAGKTIEVPAGYKAVVEFKTGDTATPGAYLNRTSFDGTAMVVESGVRAHTEAKFELKADAVVAPKPPVKPTAAPGGPKADPNAGDSEDKDKAVDAATQTDDKAKVEDKEQPAKKVDAATQTETKEEPAKKVDAVTTTENKPTANSSANANVTVKVDPTDQAKADPQKVQVTVTKEGKETGNTVTVTKTVTGTDPVVNAAATTAKPAAHQPLAKTGATSMVALIAALALAGAGAGIALARRFNA